ncbi:tetratricopeptide repeat protein [Homoserinibacter sp. GY 40078]|uniref:tetratricopeptide repeat protein n=1 Tax=Homoserinibacter sp. GY 40078 TaxID=2603275 RepID=UPI0011CB3DE4|nr:tetratricopeptide repeat protein [Homoserinibacter sp. GY 40078]TXK19693.1 tetratricopeptide repeat protein [Homoserinibacter sp. GY 40078]
MDWTERMAAVWAEADGLTDAELVRRIDEIAAEHPDEPIALFERGGARDSTGDEAGAETFYRAALAAGLPASERSQCVIQLASTVRNLGRPEESIELLREEFTDRDDDPLAEAAVAFAALALVDLGRPVEAVSALLHTLTPHLPRYHRSVHAYADALLEGPAEG